MERSGSAWHCLITARSHDFLSIKHTHVLARTHMHSREKKKKTVEVACWKTHGGGGRSSQLFGGGGGEELDALLPDDSLLSRRTHSLFRARVHIYIRIHTKIKARVRMHHQ